MASRIIALDGPLVVSAADLSRVISVVIYPLTAAVRRRDGAFDGGHSGGIGGEQPEWPAARAAHRANVALIERQHSRMEYRFARTTSDASARPISRSR